MLQHRPESEEVALSFRKLWGFLDIGYMEFSVSGCHGSTLFHVAENKPISGGRYAPQSIAGRRDTRLPGFLAIGGAGGGGRDKISKPEPLPGTHTHKHMLWLMKVLGFTP